MAGTGKQPSQTYNCKAKKRRILPLSLKLQLPRKQHFFFNRNDIFLLFLIPILLLGRILESFAKATHPIVSPSRKTDKQSECSSFKITLLSQLLQKCKIYYPQTFSSPLRFWDTQIGQPAEISQDRFEVNKPFYLHFGKKSIETDIVVDEQRLFCSVLQKLASEDSFL